MKTIKSKILTAIVACVVVSLLLVGGSAVVLNIFSTNATLKQTMSETVKLAAKAINYELQLYKSIAYEVGSLAELSNEAFTVEQKKQEIDIRVKTYGFQRGNLLDANGESLFDGNSYADREYFKRSIQGESYVSEPLVSKVTGSISIIISAPVWENGIPGGTVVGVIYFVPVETFLNDIVADIRVSQGGGAYIINKTGTTIAHKNMENVMNEENTTADAKSDLALAPLAALEGEMMAGAAGFGEYTYGGVTKFLAYAPIGGTDGWSIGINAPNMDFMSATITSICVILALLAAAVIVSIVIASLIARKISLPMRQATERLALLVQGDLASPVPTTTAQDETGTLLGDLHATVEALKIMIGDVSHHLEEMADGNFNLSLDNDYPGDIARIGVSLRGIAQALNQTLHQINEGADQVSSGADQVSSSAQALSQGATEQASAVQELAATITEISHKIRENAESAKTAGDQAQITKTEILQSNDKMQEMIEAMDNISGKSGEIGKIVKTIEDIAFQTNILALNAAVEAARAGAAGKGFAVVADEVRNLASKSAQAAKNTTALIEETLSAVKGGTEIAHSAANSMTAVVGSAATITTLIEQIAGASSEQATAAAQVTMGVDQISSVVQTNSATAEESAAASQELSGQASMLKGLVGHFRLKPDHNSFYESD